MPTYLETRYKACSLRLAVTQRYVTCSLKLKLMSIVTDKATSGQLNFRVKLSCLLLCQQVDLRKGEISLHWLSDNFVKTIQKSYPLFFTKYLVKIFPIK